MDDHDPTGHVWLSSSVNWECRLCGRDVEVVEWLDNGPYRWRWRHIDRELKYPDKK
jgi:hypothetical protein